jgi:hypothetical protein
VVKPLKPQLGHTFAGVLEAWRSPLTLTLEVAETLTSWSFTPQWGAHPKQDGEAASHKPNVTSQMWLDLHLTNEVLPLNQSSILVAKLKLKPRRAACVGR